MNKGNYPRAVSVRMSHEMYHLLEDRVSDKRKIPDLMRKIVREWLDSQEDLIGSKRNFTRSFRDEMAELRRQLTFQTTYLALLIGVSEQRLAEALIAPASEDAAIPSVLEMNVTFTKMLQLWQGAVALPNQLMEEIQAEFQDFSEFSMEIEIVDEEEDIDEMESA